MLNLAYFLQKANKKGEKLQEETDVIKMSRFKIAWYRINTHSIR